MVHRLLVLSATLFVASIGLFGCGSSDGDTDRLTIQLSWIKNSEFSGEYFADTRGYYNEEGFSSVSLVDGPTNTQDVVLSGAALVGLADAVAVAAAVADGSPLKIIGTTYQKNPFSILSIRDRANIRRPGDLIGKRIGVQTGDNEVLFDRFLRVNGIEPNQVTKVSVGYDPAPLVDGQVDGFFAFVTNESLTVQNLGYQVTNLLLADNGLPFVTEAFLVRQSSIDNDRERLKAFLKATIRGWRDAIADPDEGARLAVEVYGADLNLDINKERQQSRIQNALLVTSAETRANGLFTISESLQAKNLATMATAGFTLTASQIFDMTLLDEVYSENPELLK